MTLPKERLGVALAGCGRFGDFCLSAVADLPQLLPVGVSDTDRARALATAGRHGIAAHSDYAALLGDDRVDVVIIATPPADHAPMALAAIAAGKHVFCEKPLATSLPEATAVVQAARAHRVRLSVDYVLRWNPLYRLLRRLQGLSTHRGAPMLGRLRHFAFHNLARDDHLPPDHWFWDPEASGGIFVEHGVHFSTRLPGCSAAIHSRSRPWRSRGPRTGRSTPRLPWRAIPRAPPPPTTTSSPIPNGPSAS